MSVSFLHSDITKYNNMKLKKQKALRNFAYNIDIHKKEKGNECKIDYNNISKGFYDELLDIGNCIKKQKQCLHKSRIHMIKESVYSDKEIPKCFINKFSYIKDVCNSMSNDKKFISYLGKGKDNDGKERNCRGNKGSFFSLKKTLTVSTKESSPLSTSRDTSKGYLRFIKMIKDEKKVGKVLMSYRKKFPLSLQKNNTEDVVPHVLFRRDLNKGKGESESINICENKEEMKMKEMVMKSVYSGIFPDKRNPFYHYGRNRMRRINSEKLECNNSDYYMKKEIKNKQLKLKLADIDYFGPKYSHCYSCRNKNIDFYNSMGNSQSNKLVDYLGNNKKFSMCYKNK